MSQFSVEDEAELQSLLRQLLKTTKDRISGAPSVECAEEILLHLEETDKNFHNYEFVKYLRQYVESSLGAVIDEETENCARGDGHAIGTGQDTYKQMMQTLKNTMMVVVESLINKFEEDQLKKEEMHRKSQREQSSSHYTDNCSDSDSSFNQSYAFIKHEQLQVIADKLDPSRPKEVRWEALQCLCCAPPSDVLSCESWSGLRRNLSAALADPDPDLSDKVLRFFAKTFSSSPLNVTREIYTSLAKSLENDFLYHKVSFPAALEAMDANRQDVARLLKQMRLMNEFQKEVTSFWIRHPEKYMEEIIESTLSLLSLRSEPGLGPHGYEREPGLGPHGYEREPGLGPHGYEREPGLGPHGYEREPGLGPHGYEREPGLGPHGYEREPGLGPHGYEREPGLGPHGYEREPGLGPHGYEREPGLGPHGYEREPGLGPHGYEREPGLGPHGYEREPGLGPHGYEREPGLGPHGYEREPGLGPHGYERALAPLHLLALLDTKATWFKKWMHGYYSRTVVLRLLERKYKSVIVAAVQQCIHYSESSDPAGDETTDLTYAMEHQQISPVQRMLYTGRELEYLYFVHSLCVLGRLLMYTHGRNLFPIRVKNRKDPVTLTDLVVTFIKIMYQHPKRAFDDATLTDSLSPTALVMEVLRPLCERVECAVDCLYQPPVLEVLLVPVITLLKGRQAKLKSLESTLTHVADMLARIATTERGLSLFLYDRNLLSADGESVSAAHVIVPFTQRLLARDLPALASLDSHMAVCGAFIFVCRQMYNTCEGLQALRPYSLHESIAATWRKMSTQSERVPTPVPGSPNPASSQEPPNTLAWEETLLDNLLNFAATPRGLLLLQQTGAINECVTYMFSRFTKKLQVSRCEKFGYGVMVTQVAATAPGMVALHSSGFVQAIVVELWSMLECGREDVRVVHPKSTPMDPIDRSCLKSFLTLVNLLSSPHATWELLGGQALPNKSSYNLREMPTSIIDLIDRLIAVNSEAKIHSLLSYEQSHTFGLRLLSVMCCSLDTLLLLEAQYRLSDMLLQGQRDNVTDPTTGEGEFIIDGLSVERNHALVRMSVIGGPSERRLPPRALLKGNDPYPWPMFCSYPVPRHYILDGPKTSRGRQESELSAFLASSKDAQLDDSWMDSCRRLYCKVMTTKASIITGNVLCDLLEKAVLHLSSSPAECFFPAAEPSGLEGSGDVSCDLSPVEQLGMRTTLRYGKFLKLLKDDAEVDIALLLRRCKDFLSQQRVKTDSETLYSLQGCSLPPHDWLCSSVFLMAAGDGSLALALLLRLSRLLVSAFLWPRRLHASVHLPVELAQSGIPAVYWCTAHYVELLLKAEVPLVGSAFRMSGFTPSQMCVQWLGQCFWNYLDWPEICHYVCTCVVLGPDYQVYMCIAVLKHLQPDILLHAQTQDLQVFLKEEPISGFKVCNYLEFMEGLERRYRAMVLTDMKSILHASG